MTFVKQNAGLVRSERSWGTAQQKVGTIRPQLRLLGVLAVVALLLFAGGGPARAATPGQAVVVGVYTDIPRPMGLAYDSANDLIWYTTQADCLVHSLVPFKNFSPSQIGSFPTLNGVPQVPAALAQDSVFVTDPVANGGRCAAGTALAYDKVVGQLVSRTNVAGVLQSYAPITAAGLNPNYRPGSDPMGNPVDGLDVDGGNVWLSNDVNNTYKNGALFSNRLNPAHTTLPSWSGSGGAVAVGWSGVEQVCGSLFAVAVQTLNDSLTSRTLVRFDANTGVLVGFDPDGFGVGQHLEDLAFDGQFLYVADVFGDANGSGAVGDIYVFKVTGGLEDPGCTCVSPPSGMVAWYPLDELTGVTTVNDIAPPPSSLVNNQGTPKPGGQIGSPNGPIPLPGRWAERCTSLALIWRFNWTLNSTSGRAISRLMRGSSL